MDVLNSWLPLVLVATSLVMAVSLFVCVCTALARRRAAAREHRRDVQSQVNSFESEVEVLHLGGHSLGGIEVHTVMTGTAVQPRPNRRAGHILHNQVRGLAPRLIYQCAWWWYAPSGWALPDLF
jgi:hypothetical protein